MTTHARHLTGTLLTAAFITLALMAFNVLDTPTEMWQDHQTTKRMMDVEWGIRTYPQEVDQ